MAQEITIYEKCPQCGGSGTHQSSHGPGADPAISCNWPACNGTGYLALGKVNLNPGLTDLQDKIDEVKDKCDQILSKCDDILDAVT